MNTRANTGETEMKRTSAVNLPNSPSFYIIALKLRASMSFKDIMQLLHVKKSFSPELRF